MTTSNIKLPKTSTSIKTIAIVVDVSTHDRFKKLAKFQGMNIQTAGLQALEDWIDYIVENEVKPTMKDLRTKAKLASEIIKA